MLAKVTSKNQLTIPKSVTSSLEALNGPIEYFDISTESGRIVLTPVRVHRGDAVREKLTALKLNDSDVNDAVAWARKSK
jgi:bifunctional DNA-binding transcriptional regulator/antitoxin component of YhaV-PrlF toxin-antitoxin module